MNKWWRAVPRFLSALNDVYGGNRVHFGWRSHHIANGPSLWLHSWRGKKWLVWKDFRLLSILNYRWGKKSHPIPVYHEESYLTPEYHLTKTIHLIIISWSASKCLHLDSIRPWLPCRTGQTSLDLRPSEEPRKAIWPFSVVCLLAVRQDSGSGTVSKEEGALHRGAGEDEGKIFRFCALSLRNKVLVSMSPSEEKRFQSLLTFSGGRGRAKRSSRRKTATEEDFLPRSFVVWALPNA